MFSTIKDPKLILAITLVMAPSSAVYAQHSDVLLADVGGQVAVGSAEDIGDPNNELFSLGVSAFESIMIPGTGLVDPPDYESDEPGFYSDPAELAALGASALPGLADVSATATTFTVDGASSDLFYWDGIGAVDFSPAPVNTTFEFEPSSGFATTNSNGFLDGHPEFILENSDPNAIPADGVYLISPVVDVDTLTTSDNFYVVLLVDELITNGADAHEVEEALEALEEGNTTDAVALGKDFAFYEEAVEYVEDNIVVPEPTTGLIAFMALGLTAVSRYRTTKS